MDGLTELLKGVLEGCVLQILSSGGGYGYKIVRALNQAGFTSVSEGTVYPILLRMEKKDLVTISWIRSEEGPTRKVYTLNAKGQEALGEFWQRWEYVSLRLTMLKENGNV